MMRRLVSRLLIFLLNLVHRRPFPSQNWLSCSSRSTNQGEISICALGSFVERLEGGVCGGTSRLILLLSCCARISCRWLSP